MREERERGRKPDKEQKISKSKVKKAIKRMRDKKAAGIDEIPSKAWKCRKEKLEEWL